MRTELDLVWVPTDLSNRKSLLQQGGEFLSLDFSLPAVHCCMYPNTEQCEQLILQLAMMRIVRRAAPPLVVHTLVSVTFVISNGEAFSSAFCAAICRLTNFGVG